MPISALADDSSKCPVPLGIGTCPDGEDYYYSITWGLETCQPRIPCGAGEIFSCNAGSCYTPDTYACDKHNVDIGRTAPCCAVGEVPKWDGVGWSCGAGGVWDAVTGGINYAGGKVGIGTSTPTQKLTVYDGEFVLQTDNNSDKQGLLFQNAGAAYTWRMYRNQVGTTNNADLRFASGLQADFNNLTDKITFTTGGKIGIGTTSPDMSLEATSASIYGTPAVGGSIGTTDWAYLHLATGNHALIWNDGNDMRFGTETGKGSGWSEKMRIQSDGNVGIGTNSPDMKLSVIGRVRGSYDAAETEYVEMSHGGGNAYINWSGDGHLKFRKDGTDRATLNENGNFTTAGHYADIRNYNWYAAWCSNGGASSIWGTETTYSSCARTNFRTKSWAFNSEGKCDIDPLVDAADGLTKWKLTCSSTGGHDQGCKMWCVTW